MESEPAVFSRFNKKTKKYAYFLQTRLKILPRYDNLGDIIEIVGNDKILPKRVEEKLYEVTKKEKTAFLKILLENSGNVRNRVLEEEYKNKYSHTILLFHLNRQSLAVWFMDTGGKSKKFFFLDCKDSYKKEQVQYLLLKKWSIKTWFYKKSEKNTKVFVVKESSSRFKSLIPPYVFQSMEYKLSNI